MSSQSRVVVGDCIEVMRALEAESFDAIITDPPYGIDYQSARRIDRADWKPKIANDDRPFIWWLPAAYRLLRPSGCLLCFCRWDVAELFRLAIEAAGFTVKSQVIWDRVVHGMGDLNGSFAPRHDIIWFATRGEFAFSGKRPASVLAHPRVDAEKLVHPNEKPVPLMRDLVLSVTPEGGAVLDPFAGSGSTGLACHGAGRTFIGIEINESYAQIARQRIGSYAPLFNGGSA